MGDRCEYGQLHRFTAANGEPAEMPCVYHERNGLRDEADALRLALAAAEKRAEEAEADAALERAKNEKVGGWMSNSEAFSAEVKDGEAHAMLKGKFSRLLGTMIAEWFIAQGGVNYVEFTVAHEKTGQIVVTAQRTEGKTPHQFRAEAESERDRLARELDGALAALRMRHVCYGDADLPCDACAAARAALQREGEGRG